MNAPARTRGERTDRGSNMPTHVHRNVPLGMALGCLTATRGSLSTAFDAYVLNMPGGTNTRVGIMEGSAGVASTVCMVLGGAVADSCSRVCVLRTAAIFAAAGGTCTCLTLFWLYPNHAHEGVVFAGLCTAQAVNACGRSLAMPAMEALFGDSTPQNLRSKWYARKQACITLGLASGPLVAVAIFLFMSNSWTRPELTVVMTVSAVIGVLVSAVMLAFRERHTQEALLSPSQLPEGAASDAAQAAPVAISSSSTVEPLPPPAFTVNAEVTAAGAAEAAQPALDAPLPPLWGRSRCCGLRARHVPFLIAASNLLQGLGSGIAYKCVPIARRSTPLGHSQLPVLSWLAALSALHPCRFVPIFCWKELGLLPVETYGIVAGFQLIATALNFVIRRLARHLGPLGATVVFFVLSRPDSPLTDVCTAERALLSACVQVCFMLGGCTSLAVVIFCYSTPVVIVALLVRAALITSSLNPAPF